MSTVDWNNESELAAAARLKAEQYWTDLRRMEREREASGGYTPWCSDGTISIEKLQELATRWIWVRAGVRSNPAHQALAQQLRERGYVDAPSGLRFDGDQPGVGLYLAAPIGQHQEHLEDQRRRHERRMRELMRQPVLEMRKMGAEVRYDEQAPVSGTVEQIEAMPRPQMRQRR